MLLVWEPAAAASSPPTRASVCCKIGPASSGDAFCGENQYRRGVEPLDVFWSIRKERNSLASCDIKATAISNVEAKKRLEFLEAVSGIMDARLRYFKQACHTHGSYFSL
ncbi:hypothetical protein BC332_07208 [Capsicum chinense]|nr:hypothetical protein BC332_07208 [Capsicum chinense]